MSDEVRRRPHAGGEGSETARRADGVDRGAGGDALRAAREELHACQQQMDQLRARLLRFEQQIEELGRHCVVMERLHGALTHAEVLEGLQDCVINVIGSEELAIFEPSADRAELRPVKSFGMDGRGLGPVRAPTGPVGRAAAGRGWVTGDDAPADTAGMTACVPLVAGERVVGVLAIWRMLAHKPALGPGDRVVLELLSRHGGAALHLTARAEREA